jgi:hypothetical protein
MIGGIRACGVIVLIGLLTVSASAQLLEGKRRTTSPTPGTTQPDPPNLADRVTLTGCVQTAKRSQNNQTAPIDPNTPSGSRYVLTNAERQNIVPSGTGGSPLTTKTTSRTYRLEAIDTLLSPFVGTKVEISGEIKLPPQAGPGEAGANDPILLVEFVQKMAATCP